MKLPDFLAAFINWVEGDECFHLTNKNAVLRNSKVHKRKRHSENIKGKKRIADVLYRILAVIICVTVVSLLLITVSFLPPFGEKNNPEENSVYIRYVESGLEEAGAVNTVADMILDYRAFDTLGESNVLFIAVCSVLILLRADRNKDGQLNIPELQVKKVDKQDDEILQSAAKLLLPVLLVFGICVILNGHLSAGGGFSGGAILGGALILYVNAFGFERIDRFFTFRTYRRITFTSLIYSPAHKAFLSCYRPRGSHLGRGGEYSFSFRCRCHDNRIAVCSR